MVCMAPSIAEHDVLNVHDVMHVSFQSFVTNMCMHFVSIVCTASCCFHASVVILLAVASSADVLLSFDGVDIASDGTVPFRSGERISFSYLVSEQRQLTMPIFLGFLH